MSVNLRRIPELDELECIPDGLKRIAELDGLKCIPELECDELKGISIFADGLKRIPESSYSLESEGLERMAELIPD
jgi:hypothetical protein